MASDFASPPTRAPTRHRTARPTALRTPAPTRRRTARPIALRTPALTRRRTAAASRSPFEGVGRAVHRPFFFRARNRAGGTPLSCWPRPKGRPPRLRCHCLQRDRRVDDLEAAALWRQATGVARTSAGQWKGLQNRSPFLILVYGGGRPQRFARAFVRYQPSRSLGMPQDLCARRGLFSRFSTDIAVDCGAVAPERDDLRERRSLLQSVDPIRRCRDEREVHGRAVAVGVDDASHQIEDGLVSVQR